MKLKIFIITMGFFYILMLSSCKKDTIYLSEEKKEAFLYYAYNNGDVFKMHTQYNGEADTLTYTVDYVKLGYGYNDKNQNIEYLAIGLFHDYGGGSTEPLNYDMIYVNDKEMNFLSPAANLVDLKLIKDTALINGHLYNNVYKLYKNNTLSAYTTRDLGIIKLWFGNIEYTKVGI